MQGEWSIAVRILHVDLRPDLFFFLTTKEQSKNAVYYELIRKDLRKQFLIFILFAELFLGHRMILLSLSWSNFAIQIAEPLLRSSYSFSSPSTLRSSWINLYPYHRD